MTKVKCEDCRFWLFSHEQRMRKGNYIVSFSFSYETVRKGNCLNDKCANETGGYTGSSSGHKMAREGSKERYCRYFEPTPPLIPHLRDNRK